MAASCQSTGCPSPPRTVVLPVDPARLGHVENNDSHKASAEWTTDSQDFMNLQLAATKLQSTDIPVAFPTETVYGLGADATRSAAVQGIYKAKQRPSDNPLIVHFHSVKHLREVLGESADGPAIPSIYQSLIERFWPGPLTIILPNPPQSPFAPEVTAGLNTFGARVPGNPLARALIKLAGRPLAAPSANASTRPSPTAAEHVKQDLDGRIEVIIDGGACSVGLESTVVDGLTSPPAILRPGGISLEEVRECPGWEGVVIGYKDAAENGARPRAPGMKYRHYSPKAPVFLSEAGSRMPTIDVIESVCGPARRVGIVRTEHWRSGCGMPLTHPKNGAHSQPSHGTEDFSEPPEVECLQLDQENPIELWEVNLGDDPRNIARHLFFALRELDKRGVEAIFVEGIPDQKGDLASAIMNRLRKAATK